jgi:hypothetical protein
MENSLSTENAGQQPVPAGVIKGNAKFSYSEEDKRLVLGRQVPLHTKDEDLRYFWMVAEARGLDPFCDYLYGEYEDDSEKDGASIFKVHPTLAGYRFKAEETGKYGGTTTPEFCGEDGQWTDVWLRPELPAACKVGVWKEGFGQAQYHVVLMKDYERLMESNAYWKVSPENSIGARAETGALKRAFPSLGGGVTLEERFDPKLLRKVEEELGRKSPEPIAIKGVEGQSPDAKGPPKVSGEPPAKKDSPNQGEMINGLGGGLAFDVEIPYEKKELKGSTFGTITSAQFFALARKYGAGNDQVKWKVALRAVLSELERAGAVLRRTPFVLPEAMKIAGKEIVLPLDTLRGLRLGRIEGVDKALAEKLGLESLGRLPLGVTEKFLGEFRALKEGPEEAGKKNGTGVNGIKV